MKVMLCFLLSLYSCIPIQAQIKTIKKEKLVLHTPFRFFFEKNKELKEIRFHKQWITDSLELELLEKDTNVIQAFNQFDLEDEGERYFFQKRFGEFIIPPSFYAKWVDTEADNSMVSGIIRNDSIFLTIEDVYFPKDDNKYFIKVEQKSGYEKGVHVLAKELEEKLSALKVVIKDTVTIVRGIIERNGRFACVDFEKGENDSEYGKQIISFLNTSGPWIPYKAGGRAVRAYKKVYLRLNADKTFQIAVK